MTTYSHKVGLYQETVESYELVLGDGSRVVATRDNQYSDLYHCLPWSDKKNCGAKKCPCNSNHQVPWKPWISCGTRATDNPCQTLYPYEVSHMFIGPGL